jgi:hypothetical protein
MDVLPCIWLPVYRIPIWTCTPVIAHVLKRWDNQVFFRSILRDPDGSAYTTSGRSGGQGSAGKQPERRLRGQDQARAGFELSPSNQE